MLTSARNREMSDTANPAATEGRPIHIRCVVEYVPQDSVGGATDAVHVLTDGVATVPGGCPFVDIVPAALYYLGYSTVDAIGARGMLQIKNWKPVSCDVITDCPSATVDSVLGGGQLAPVTTLRIRLYGRSRKLSVAEDIKGKLLTYLLDRLQYVLVANGCPIDENLLTQLTRGETTPNALPESTRLAFDRWFRDQCPVPSTATTLDDSSDHPERHSRSRSVTPEQNSRRWNGSTPTSRSPAGRAMDVEKMAESAREDDMCGGRPRSVRSEEPKVDHAVRNNSLRPSSVHESNGPETVPSRQLPVLPNRNAVYVYDAILPPNVESPASDFGSADNSADEEMEIATEFDDDVVDEVCTVNGKPNRQTSGGNDTDLTQRPRSKANPDVQHEATDLSLRRWSGVGRKPEADSKSIDEDQKSGGSGSKKCQSGSDGGYDDGASSPSPPASTPLGFPPHLGSASNGLFMGASPSLFAGSSNNPLSALYQHHQRALQMAAMSRAAVLGLHWARQGLDSAQGVAETRLGMKAGHRPTPLTSSAHMFGDYLGVPGLVSPIKSGMHGQASSESGLGSDGKSMIGPMSGLNVGGHGHGVGGNGGMVSKRSRVFIDPLTEIPKLERWFADDTHPSSYVIEKYTEELNRSPYRQRFPRLEPKNLQLWFKNHRAKVKRQRDAYNAAAAGGGSIAPTSAPPGIFDRRSSSSLVAADAGGRGEISSSVDGAGSASSSPSPSESPGSAMGFGLFPGAFGNGGAAIRRSFRPDGGEQQRPGGDRGPGEDGDLSVYSSNGKSGRSGGSAGYYNGAGPRSALDALVLRLHNPMSSSSFVAPQRQQQTASSRESASRER